MLRAAEPDVTGPLQWEGLRSAGPDLVEFVGFGSIRFDRAYSRKLLIRWWLRHTDSDLCAVLTSDKVR